MPEKEMWGILVREDSPLAEKEAVHPGDLAGVPLLMAKRELVQNELINWFGYYSEQMKIVMTYNAAMMVKQGIGAALCLELENRIENLCFVPLSPGIELGSVLAWKKNQVFSPAASAFIRHVKK